MRDINGKHLHTCDYVEDTISGELLVIIGIRNNEVDTVPAANTLDEPATTVGQPSFVQRDCADFCFLDSTTGW
jgi:hypothetical protein